MPQEAKSRFGADFRRFFLRGLATLLPTILTIVIVVKCFEFIRDNIGVHITEGVIRVVVLVGDEYPRIDEAEKVEYAVANKYKMPLSESDSKEIKGKIQLLKLREEWNHGYRALVGFFLAIVLVYIVGRLLASFLGKKIWNLFETTVQQIPIFKQVYPYIKQVTEYLFGENRIQFTRVVAVEYPRKGIWSLGLVTGAGFRQVMQVTKEDYLTIFIPSSPTPVTGYVITVKREEVIDLPISIEEALRFTISGGVIDPSHQDLTTQIAEMTCENAKRQNPNLQ